MTLTSACPAGMQYSDNSPTDPILENFFFFLKISSRFWPIVHQGHTDSVVYFFLLETIGNSTTTAGTKTYYIIRRHTNVFSPPDNTLNALSLQAAGKS